MIGCVFALTSLFGNNWILRLGIGVLAVSAFIALRAVKQEVVEARKEGHAQLLAGEQTHQELLNETRDFATVVSEVMTQRNNSLAAELTSTRTDLAEARAEVVTQNQTIGEQLGVISTLKGDLAAAHIERDELATEVAELVAFVDSLDDSDESDSGKSDSADVIGLPRRVRRPVRSDVWGTEELPSVAEMVQFDAKDLGKTQVRKQA